MFRWFEDLNAVQEQLNQVYEEAYGRKPQGRAREQGVASWMPPVEVWENESSIYLSFDLPGLTIQEIDLQIEGEQLIIKGERKAPEEKRNYRRREKLYGNFYRAFNITTPVDREKVAASYRNGMLEVMLPKSEAVKPKQIKISVEE
ncbi:MAG: Hsp20/alpha crystallin family protein [Candidatus Eremiobacteraeota bacterium]|nr:Hsp20/alpha crystallin family protein [Candidatus Eremiobacteraeota bacterium]